MKKAILFLLLLFAIIISCRRKDEIQKKIITNKKVVYVGRKSNASNESLLKLYSKEIASGFILPDIKNSDKEIRIYYLGTFKHRFFRQVQNNDSIEVQIFNCGIKESNDSLFYIHDKQIELSGSTSSDLPFPLNDFPNEYITSTKSSQDADGPADYFIEYKNKEKLKSIFINENEIESLGIGKNQIAPFLNRLYKFYSFEFTESYDSTIENFGKKVIK